MTIQRLDPTTMTRMPGLHQTVRAGNTIYIAGQVALDEEGNFHGEGSAAAQLSQIYKNLARACEAYGGTLADMVKTTTYITNPVHITAVSEARQEAYGSDAPVNATVVVAGLVRPEWWVEIEGTAWIEG